MKLNYETRLRTKFYCSKSPYKLEFELTKVRTGIHKVKISWLMILH